MSELFGIPMNAIMYVLLALLAACLLVFAWVFIANRSMYRMGVRNIPRRRAQSMLVVCGLMLATVIITAAFLTGDSIDYSATNTTYDNLQRTDISLHHFRPTAAGASSKDIYAPEAATVALEQRFAGDPDIEGFMPFLYEPVPILNPRTSLGEPAAILAGLDTARLERFGGFSLVRGGKADLEGLADDQVLLGKRIAGKIDAVAGDTIQVFAGGQAFPLKVVGVVEDERASGTLEFGTVVPVTGMAVKLATAQRITDHPDEVTTINVAVRGGVRGSLGRAGEATARLEALQRDDASKQPMGLGGIAFQVEQIKQEAIDGSKLAASIYTTLFLVLGLFSIAAGTMLIFTLFVMLAGERRTEMGIARAIGAQRSHLVQAFVAEGAVYDLLAGILGVGLGVGAAIGLVLGGKLLVGETLDMMQPHITVRSLVVSFCLGGVMTFITVVVSSLRISRLNIVSAIRGGAGGGTPEATRRIRWGWVALGVPALVLPPLGLYVVLHRGFGVPWTRIAGPGGVVCGVALTLLGGFGHIVFLYTLGVSLVILSGATVAESRGVARRLAWSLAGLLLAIFWLLPNDVGEAIFGKFRTYGMEMFVLSGVMIVIGFTLLIVFNAGLLETVFATRRRGRRRYLLPAALMVAAAASLLAGVFGGDFGDGVGQLAYLLAAFFATFAVLSLAAARVSRYAPAFRMAVAYPLANRFRTGMTIAMFSLVIFSITVMGIMNGSWLAMLTSDDGRGGWDVQVFTGRSNPIADLPASLRASNFDPSAITAVGRVTGFDDNSQEARQPGGEWTAYPVISGDDAFYQDARMKLDARAEGYASDRAVFDAVRSTEGLALIDSAPFVNNAMNTSGGLKVSDVDPWPGTFRPFPIEVRDRVTGASSTVTVVGMLSADIPANMLIGIYTNEATYRPVLGEPDYNIMFVRLEPGADATRMAKSIKAALVTKGVQAVSIKEQIDTAVSSSLGMVRMFQAFMALGLLVGIAALGVIALRSVVERRQQIGMLRAIGYQRGAVALAFLLESGFIALMGILAGVVGATLLSWQLVTREMSDAPFTVPWIEITIEVTLALAFALLMTWWPSRRAASVPVAEALRYE